MARETVDTLCRKAQEAIAQGNNEQARFHYQQALGLRSDVPDVHYGLATVLFLMGDLASSAYHFKEVTRLDPSRAGAYVNLGAVYNRLEMYDEAVGMLRRGIQLDMNRAEGYYNLGLVYRKKGQPDMAIQAYREATRINPRMADAHYNIANIYLEKGQFGLAIAHYQHALEIRPNWEKALRGLEQAEVLQGEGEHEGAAAPPTPQPSRTETGSGVTPAENKPVDLERPLDPNVHGDLLRPLHRATIDSENQGRQFLHTLLQEVEPLIKELSSALLYTSTSPHDLDGAVRKFQQSVRHLEEMRQSMELGIDRIRMLGDQLFKA